MKPNLPNLTIVDHPLIADKVSRMRDKTTPHYLFKRLLDEISPFLFFEASRWLETQETPIETPLEAMNAQRLKKEVLLAPILRAGLGMVNSIAAVVPAARVGMIGMYRDHDTLQPVDYYLRLPEDLSEMDVFLLDPMLATGGSVIDGVSKLKSRRARKVTMISLISAPEGARRLYDAYPDVQVFTAALDRELNDIGYILPGLGDAGDRYFGL